MQKYVSYDDMFEQITIYTTDGEKHFDFNHQHESPYMGVPYEYAFDYTVSDDIASFVVLNENEKAYYTYWITYGGDDLTYYADSIYDEDATCMMWEIEYGEKSNKAIIHEHGKVIVVFDFLPCGVIKLKRDSPVQFKTEEDFQIFINECWRAGIENIQYIERFTIPITDDDTFDATRRKEVKVHFER